MKCLRYESENSIKSGFARGKQRSKCKACHCHFVESSPKAGVEEHRQVVKLHKNQRVPGIGTLCVLVMLKSSGTETELPILLTGMEETLALNLWIRG